MSMNNATFTGRVGRDSELKNHSGSDYLKFSLAVDIGWGENKTTMWVDCSLWGQRAAKLNAYVNSGQQLCVCGSIEAVAWIDTKTNQPRAGLRMRVAELDLIGPRQEQQQQAPPTAAPSQGGGGIPDDVPF